MSEHWVYTGDAFLFSFPLPPHDAGLQWSKTTYWRQKLKHN